MSDLKTAFVVRGKSGKWETTPAYVASPHVRRAAEIANWIEQYLFIARKDQVVERLVVNAAQAILLNFLAFCWVKGLLVRCLIPKSRQMGVSTWWQAVAYAIAVLESKNGRAFRAATIAHIEKTAIELFAISRLFDRNLDPAWQLSLDSRQKGHMAWETGSALHVVSAKLGDSALKGVTLNFLHGSEVANWADNGANPSTLWGTANGTLAPGALVAFESTAKGRDAFFYGMVQESRARRSPFATVFLPWYLCDDYRMTWRSYRDQKLALGHEVPVEFTRTADEVALAAAVAAQVVRPGSEWWSHPYVLKDEQLIWRRYKIEELEGKLDVFQRYFPSLIDECFSSTEKALFSAATLDWLWTTTKDPAQVGNLRADEDGRVVFEFEENGPVTVWVKPIAGRTYVIGADVSEGQETGDAQAAVVVDKISHEVVATVHCRMEEDLYGQLLDALGRWYNDALLAIENNFSPAVASGRFKARYPNLYWYRPKVNRGRAEKPGWNTNRFTRHAAVEVVLPATLRDRDLVVNDTRIAGECGSFVWDVREQRYQAATGQHDDLVIALAIAVYVCDWRSDKGERYTDAPKGEAPVNGFALWEAEKKRMAEREKLRKAGEPGPRCVL